jgi:PQQ-dependent dehydrogenase (methanol/ethanol family)
MVSGGDVCADVAHGYITLDAPWYHPRVMKWLISIGLVILLAADGSWRAPSARNFSTAGGNLANQRYSSLTRINKRNISKLGGAWTIRLEDGKVPPTMQATPIVVDGVLYISTGAGNIFAMDAATGARKWKHETGMGGNYRGVAVGEGRVYSGERDNQLIALDEKTGAVVWKTRIADPVRGATSAPAIYYDGLVYIGVAGGEGGVRGQFGAYDAKTGKEVWKFWTLPGPGERGHETWEGDSWKYGGGPVWTHPAIDPEVGMVYVPVGNASPDNDGTERAGDNLFTVSILALDLKTGAYKWHFQEVHHDIWDYDNAISPVLADIRYEGRSRRVLIHGGKTGYLYILDRVTGKPLIGIDERPVPQEPRQKTAATQPYPRGDSYVPTCPEPGSVAEGVKSSCMFGGYWTEPVVMAPGTLGGSSWAPMTFSPQTNLIYVPGTIINSAYTLRRQAWDEANQRFKPLDEGRGFYRPEGTPRAGTLTAIDPATNNIVWQKRTKYPWGTGSGLLSTAAGLLFHGESDGNMAAYDIANGELLWKFQTGSGADAPVATYEVNGEQYIALLAGGSSFQLSQRSDALWAFKIGGTVPQPPAPPEPPLKQPPPPQRGRGM